MREILFRGKRLDNGECVDGCLAAYDLMCPNYPQDTSNATGDYYGQTPYVGFVEVDPETVGQFTGLTDKNGKRIFEGDIIKADNGKQSSVSVVKFGEYYPKMFYVMMDIYFPIAQHINANGFFAESTKHEDMILFKSPFFEIIGNVYDNPELLEK